MASTTLMMDFVPKQKASPSNVPKQMNVTQLLA
jgi:hypothetical protein